MQRASPFLLHSSPLVEALTGHGALQTSSSEPNMTFSLRHQIPPLQLEVIYQPDFIAGS